MEGENGGWKTDEGIRPPISLFHSPFSTFRTWCSTVEHILKHILHEVANGGVLSLALNLVEGLIERSEG
jgi:hypothetical protein